jgi:AcrR family transcriptional regulator
LYNKIEEEIRRKKMAVLTKETIFSAAEEIIIEKGVQKTTLSDIAKALGVTHAAFYKHYKNKEDLLQQLAFRWLEATSKELMEWEAESGMAKADALHDWLWLLASTKKKLYEDDARMFRLYTDYLENTHTLVNSHLIELAKKAEAISGLSGQGPAIIKAFVYFHNPYFADRWHHAQYKEDFEAVWRLVSRS